MTHSTLEPPRPGALLGPGLGRVTTRSVVLWTAEDPLALDCGRTLGPVEVAYETYGTLAPDGANVVVVPHALTGDAHAAGEDAHGSRGWWDALIGPGRAIDTDRFLVVASNLLGGCAGTTGPSSVNPATGAPYGLDFPPLTVGDLVRVQRRLVAHLGARRVHAVVGGSLGGMQAVEWAQQDPGGVDRVAAICASSRLSAQNIALSVAAREAILRDPDFAGGAYVGTGRVPAAGLAAARMLGHVTYLSEEAMEEKFGRARRADGAAGGGTPGPAAPGDAAREAAPPPDARAWLRPSFEVEHYLHHQAETFLARFDALTYLYLTRVMDDVDPFGRPDADDRGAAVAAAGVRHLVASFSSDWRFGPHHSDALAAGLRARGIPVQRAALESPWGHDSFLLPLPDYLETVRAFLA